MNQVTIEFGAMQRYCKIYIDGEHISEFSDLASCESKDLHVCGNRLIQLLDDEIGDDYVLEIKGDIFQQRLIKVLAESSEYCQEVREASIDCSLSLDEEIDFLINLTHKYSLTVENDFSIKAAGSAVATIDLPYVIAETSEPELLVEYSVPEKTMRGMTVVVLDDHIEVRHERGMNLVVLPRERVSEFFTYYFKYCKQIPFADKAISLCRYVNMNAEDRIRLSAYIEQKAKYIFRCDASQCDLGETIPCIFEVFPHSAASAYRIMIDTPDIIEITENQIATHRAGTAKIRIVDTEGKTCEEKQITVIERSFVTSIRLLSDFKYLQKDQKGKISAYVMPESAEDAKEIVWTSSNSDTAFVTSTGEVVALKAGRVRIRAACRKAVAELEIEVRPGLESIRLSKSSISVPVGESETISCNLFPENAAHGEIVWELDNDGVGSITQTDEGKTCHFTATTSSLAKGTLKCRVKGTSKSATCSISIIPDQTPTGLKACTIIFTILGILFSFFIPVSWAAGSGIAGYFIDFMLPLSLLLSLIGKSKTDNKVKAFSTCLTLNLIFTSIMFLLAITCCN